MERYGGSCFLDSGLILVGSEGFVSTQSLMVSFDVAQTCITIIVHGSEECPHSR